jgi:predicted esterase YcpF (UPF0227 family)
MIYAHGVPGCAADSRNLDISIVYLPRTEKTAINPIARIVAMSDKRYDFVIIGSGAGGATLAK